MRKATVFKTTLLLFLLAQAMPAAFAQQDESAPPCDPLPDRHISGRG